MDHGSSSILLVVDGLVYAAHALPHFNDTLIQQIRQQCVTTPGNELRGITSLATQLLVSACVVLLQLAILSNMPLNDFLSFYHLLTNEFSQAVVQK